MRKLLKHIPAFASDTVWTAGGFLILNLCLQALIYPQWTEVLGNEGSGNVLYLIAFTDIFAVTMGTACSYARLKESVGGDPGRASYTVVLAAAGIAALPLCFLIARGNPATPDTAACLLYFLVTVLRMIRYWGMVFFNLRKDYRGMFLYHLVISAGFALGYALFARTGLWALSLLPGEALGVVYLLLRDRTPRGRISPVLIRSCLLLALSYLISNVFYNADKLILKNLVSAEAVTIFQLSAWGGRVMSLLASSVDAVLIGYLARKQETPDGRSILRLGVLSLAAALVLSLGAFMVSMVWIRLRYAYNYALVSPYFLPSNAAYAVFFVTEVVTVFLLRYCPSRLQVYVNLVFLLGFVLCMLCTSRFGLNGFILSFLVLNLIRLVSALLLGWHFLLRRSRAAS